MRFKHKIYWVFNEIQILSNKLQSELFDIKIKKFKKPLPKEAHAITSWSDRSEGYRVICKLAAENEYVFRVFKRCSEYRNILEQVEKVEGRGYFDIIQNEGGDLLPYFTRFKQNDLFGKPFTYRYGSDVFSPTTLRYIKVLIDLKNNFGNLNNFDIIEIGGGYGGQCKIISDVFHPRSYAIVDLDEVVPLIEKYLERLGVKNFICLTQNQLDASKKYDLAISNYAFSECIKKTQDDYMARILSHSKRGYLTCNYSGRSSAVSPYSREEIVALLSNIHAIRIMEETPKTYLQNFIIMWDDTRAKV